MGEAYILMQLELLSVGVVVALQKNTLRI